MGAVVGSDGRVVGTVGSAVVAIVVFCTGVVVLFSGGSVGSLLLDARQARLLSIIITSRMQKRIFFIAYSFVGIFFIIAHDRKFRNDLLFMEKGKIFATYQKRQTM